jgi:hypothetical protein
MYGVPRSHASTPAHANGIRWHNATVAVHTVLESVTDDLQERICGRAVFAILSGLPISFQVHSKLRRRVSGVLPASPLNSELAIYF